MDFSDQFRVTGKKTRLANTPTSSKGPFETKEQGQQFTRECVEKIRVLQYRMFVERKQSLLVVLQAPDAAGKDGLIRHVLGRINAQGCSVHPFKVPTELEASHDFLWRVHSVVPSAGRIAIFNRSHYEDVLVVRVNNLVPKNVWQARYEQINQFENLLQDSGTKIIKLYLHISRREQLERFKARLDEPDKHWKLNVGDYEARDQQADYAKAYEDVFAKCNSDEAPWYIIPADRKWFRDAAVAAIVLKTMEAMNPKLPDVTVDLDHIRQLYESELAEMQEEHAS